MEKYKKKRVEMLNQMRDLKRHAIKNKAILSFKYCNLMKKISFIQISVIFFSTAITFMETVKSQYNYSGGFWDLIPIILATYIALVTTILRFFKWEDLKEEVSKSKENHIFIINKFIKSKNLIENIEISENNLENWKNTVSTYENDTFDNYVSIRETFDSIMNYKDVIFYKNKFRKLYLQMTFINNDIEQIHNNKNKKHLKYVNDDSWCNYFCCVSKIKTKEYFNDLEKNKNKCTIIDEAEIEMFSDNDDTDDELYCINNNVVNNDVIVNDVIVNDVIVNDVIVNVVDVIDDVIVNDLDDNSIKSSV